MGDAGPSRSAGALRCTGSSPYTVTYTFDRALRAVTAVTAAGCR